MVMRRQELGQELMAGRFDDVGVNENNLYLASTTFIDSLLDKMEGRYS